MGRKRINPIYNRENLGINPFVAGSFNIEAVKVRNKRKIADVTDLVANSDAVITEINEYNYTSILEKETYCKVFNRSTLRIHIGSLTTKARDLFLWIIYEKESGDDLIAINVDRYRLEFNVSYNTYRAALDELIFQGILALTSVDRLYWINPLFIFSGNRIKKYPNNVNIVNY